MKSKFLKKSKEEEIEEEEELENEDFDDIEVDDNGPSIASANKSKFTVIAASSVLITVVLYFFFFKAPEEKKMVLEPVSLPNVTPGASPYEFGAGKEIEEVEESVQEIDSTPELPTVPLFPEGVEETVIKPPKAPEITYLNTPKVEVDPLVQNPAEGEINTNIEGKDSGKSATKRNPQVDPRYSPIIVFSGGGNVASSGVGYDDNIVNVNEDPIGSLAKTVPGIQATYIDDRTHAIVQGKLLTAVLETAINTEVPGSVRAIISRDVYGESGNNVLIPRGSRLYGSYSSSVSRGQARVDIAWTRLIRSDGVDLQISFNASDQFGRAGIPGAVDNKYSSIITSSLLTSVLAVSGAVAAQQLIGDNADTTATTTAGVTTTTGNASAQAVSDVTQAIVGTVQNVVNNSLDLTPTITVPQGTKITVVVNADMKIPSLEGR